MKDKKLNCGIYKIGNLINGHCYIGQSVNLNSRKYGHFHSLKNGTHSNRHFQYAFDKYGEENFIFKIILYCEQDQLTYYEQKFVDLYNPEYNIRKECVDSNAGIKASTETIEKRMKKFKEIGHPWKGKHHSDKTKKLLSDINTGKKHTEESRRKMSAFQKGKIVSEETKILMSKNHADFSGENNPNFGKPMSEEQKDILKKVNTGRKHTEEELNKMRGSKTEEHKRHMSENHANFKGKNSTSFASKSFVINVKILLANKVPVLKIRDIMHASTKTIYKVKNGYYDEVYGF
jgi:hypothetical protein